jgi:tRNA(adenine34) deaminase
MNFDSDHGRFMDIAIADAHVAAAEGNTAVAAVIVRDGVVLSVSHATQQTACNPCNHAETNAIGVACAQVGSTSLEGATLYCTLEPCPMCAWAIQLAGIRRVVIGARYSDLGRTDLGDYCFEAFMRMVRKQVELVTGIRHAECVAFRRDWMLRTGRST